LLKKKKDHETLLQLCLDQQNRFPRNEESLRITESNLLIAYTGLSMLDKAEAIHIKRVEEHPDNARGPWGITPLSCAITKKTTTKPPCTPKQPCP
jgi:hypothetical protein